MEQSPFYDDVICNVPEECFYFLIMLAGTEDRVFQFYSGDFMNVEKHAGFER